MISCWPVLEYKGCDSESRAKGNSIHLRDTTDISFVKNPLFKLDPTSKISVVVSECIVAMNSGSPTLLAVCFKVENRHVILNLFSYSAKHDTKSTNVLV